MFQQWAILTADYPSIVTVCKRTMYATMNS